MDTITLPALMVLASLSAGAPEAEISKIPAPQQFASATCSLSGQQRVGPRKYCYYDCGGTTRTIVVAAGRTCAFTIRR
ncbi:MAG: hypothetical protein Q7V31_07795 [Parvibaculum sp.]|uniref:hypothetical protein n=1 Tax=Parvibaculum sp. TaxID=2024848 RepID=UPI0027251828|nr:hypothetical protein [Parvibaculum sp.]MDO8838820.1 hypothetical protein [Parvibaculum sp.]